MHQSKRTKPAVLLGKAGTVAAAGAAAGMLGGLPLATEVSAAPERERAGDTLALGGSARAGQAYAIRLSVAQGARQVAKHPDNGDEMAYASRIGSYTKGLPHNARGEVDPAAYLALLSALRSGRSTDFEALPLGGPDKEADPQGAYAFQLEGPDSGGLSAPVPPTFSSAQQAAELAELYWQALARDIPFAAYATNPVIGKAAADLTRLSGFQGPKTTATLFQMGFPGEAVGPYLSQFWWLPIAYGAMTVPQLYPAAPSTNFMTTFDAWLSVQNGQYLPPKPPVTPPPPPATRYLCMGRDLCTFLHSDFLYQAYLNAALILNKLAAPPDDGNPYKKSKTQAGNTTFGSQHLLDLVAKVANAALRACWYQKWLVHRRARPENVGGRVQLIKTNVAQYPVHADLLTTSSVLDAVYQAQGSYLLAQAYPEGAPLHPSYPAAHTVVAAACVTVLKAWFDESYVLPTAVAANGRWERRSCRIHRGGADRGRRTE